MVEVQCPHCYEDIELEDEVYGLFECPCCGEEFEFELENEPELTYEPSATQPSPDIGSNALFKLGIGFLFSSIIILALGIKSISSVPDDFDNTSTKCDEPIWIDNWYEDRGCSTEGDYGADSLCGGIFIVIIGIVFAIVSFVSLFVGSPNKNKKVILIEK